jgi:FkbM family methyltransferase
MLFHSHSRTNALLGGVILGRCYFYFFGFRKDLVICEARAVAAKAAPAPSSPGGVSPEQHSKVVTELNEKLSRVKTELSECRAGATPLVTAAPPVAATTAPEKTECNAGKIPLDEVSESSNQSMKGSKPFKMARGAMNTAASFLGGVEGQINNIVLTMTNSGTEVLVFVFFLSFLILLKRWPKTTGIDVGGNIGWFSMLGAANGLKMYPIEPQPGCLPYIRAAICSSGLEDKVVLTHAACSKKEQQVMIPTQGCSGLLTWSEAETAKATETAVSTISLQQLAMKEKLPQQIGILKIDTEGSEIDVLDSGFPDFWKK